LEFGLFWSKKKRIGMGLRKATLWGLLLVLTAGVFSCTSEKKANVLVFSKTEGFRHESIEAGIAALKKMASEKGFDATFTEESEDFNSANLAQYQAVVFLNTTGDVLDAEQQDAFERFIQAGGGYVGIHSATDTEYDWPWYGRLAGAYFKNHPNDPNVRTATMVVQKRNWATEGMPDEFEKTDEFYNFRNISPDIQVVLTVDEDSYEGGENGDFHPMSWFQEYDGGRAFYTAMGHTSETFSEPIFLNHLWAGIQYAVGRDELITLDYSRARPEENRFTKVVLADNLNEPMELTLLDEDRILFTQRNGQLRMYKNSTQELKTIANIPVSTSYEGRENSRAEDGLLGLNKDPDFAENHWIYLFYASPEKPVNLLSRFEMEGDELILESEKVLLEVPVQRKECCHTGGSIAWDREGNLYLSTGDNTNPHESDGYSPTDERPGRGPWDAQKSSANTNDLRGKILRIKPQPDGSYTIPEGNLFPEGTPNTRPEIYTMGHRNPYRISVDPKTGYLYWGDVGPDASLPDPDRGPAGHDEIGQAREAGNFGWPHFVGDNKAYHRYDFAKKVTLEPWDPDAPLNTSPNNTRLENLPPAKAACIW
jgi:cytochrome c